MQERIELGTHFAAPTEDAIVVAEELQRRFGLPKWRYVNSGSEATMDAIRIARAATGRDTIVKIFGSYHGHHDYVMVSIGVDYDKIGDHFGPLSLPYGAGIPQAVVDMTVAVPFNDAEAMERRIERLFEEGRPPACVIMEPALMNLGVVLPEPGYLEAVREITRRHGVLLIFDEVKTGLCIAAGGGTERFGVTPDLVTLAKALGGGLPSGAIGGTEEAFELVEAEKVVQVGTYNGNPLSMAAARANLLEVLTPDAYAHLDALNDHILAGCQAVIDKYSFPGYSVGVGSKGVRHVLARADRRLRDVQGEPGRRAVRARVALQHEPRHLHDSRPRGGVDALDHPLLRGLRPVRGHVRGDGRRSDRVAVNRRGPVRGTRRSVSARRARSPPPRVRRQVVDRARRRRDALEPRRHRRIRGQVVAGVAGDPRVRVQRAVGDGVAAADEELLPRQAALERSERTRPRLEVTGERLRPLGVAPGQLPEAGRADVRLEQVLLEEHPRVHVSTLDAVVGQERRAFGEVEEDRARLGDRGAVARLEQRRAAGGVPGEVVGGL